MELEVRAARRVGDGRLRIDDGTPLLWTASADSDAIELAGPRPEAFTSETAAWIGDQLRSTDFTEWRRERWCRLRAEAGDPAYAGGQPPEEVDGMVYFHEVFPWSFDLTVVHDRRCYAIVDCYCLEPDCRCDSVAAQFIDLSHDVAVGDAEIGMVQASLGNVTHAEVEAERGALLHELWRVAIETHGTKALRERYRRMREVARRRRRAAAPPRPEVARKAPCPCGSGKKYKRCCGAED